jgi:hypothetical protein
MQFVHELYLLVESTSSSPLLTSVMTSSNLSLRDTAGSWTMDPVRTHRHRAVP